MMICPATVIWNSLHQQLESQYSLGVCNSAETSARQKCVFQH